MVRARRSDAEAIKYKRVQGEREGPRASRGGGGGGQAEWGGVGGKGERAAQLCGSEKQRVKKRSEGGGEARKQGERAGGGTRDGRGFKGQRERTSQVKSSSIGGRWIQEF